MDFKQFVKLIQMSRNVWVWRVRASGCASDHFWQLGVSNIRFWGKNGKNPWPKHAKTHITERCACTRAL